MFVSMLSDDIVFMNRVLVWYEERFGAYTNEMQHPRVFLFGGDDDR